MQRRDALLTLVKVTLGLEVIEVTRLISQPVFPGSLIPFPSVSTGVVILISEQYSLAATSMNRKLRLLDSISAGGSSLGAKL